MTTEKATTRRDYATITTPSPRVVNPDTMQGRGQTATPRVVPVASLWPEIVQLYYNVNAMRPFDEPRVIQFLSAHPTAGTSTIATEFARVAATRGDRAVLIIDANVQQGGALPGLLDLVAIDRPIDAAFEPMRGVLSGVRARLTTQLPSLLHAEPAALAQLFAILRRRFSCVVLDSPASGVATDALVPTRCTDGVVLVIEAEATRRPVVAAAAAKIETFGGELLGAVLNKRRAHIPRWIYRHL